MTTRQMAEKTRAHRGARRERREILPIVLGWAYRLHMIAAVVEDGLPYKKSFFSAFSAYFAVNSSVPVSGFWRRKNEGIGSGRRTWQADGGAVR